MEHVPVLLGTGRFRVLVALTAALSVILAGLGFSLATPASAAITLVAAPTLPAAFTVGTPVPTGLAFTTTGAVGAVSFAVTVPDTTPPGVTVTSAGELVGTPTAAGDFTFSVTASDPGDPDTGLGSSTAVSGVVSVTVNPAPALLPKTFTINGAVGSELLAADVPAFTSEGLGSGVKYFAPAGFPADFTVAELTGVITGTPSAVSTGTYTITATGTLASATADVTIDVPAAAVTPAASTVNATVGIAHPGVTFTAVGIAAPVFTIRPKDQPEGSPADLPPGIELLPTGELTVAPTTSALTKTYTVTAKDLVNSASTDVTITVNAAPLTPALQTVAAFVGTAITPTAAFAPTDLVTPITYTITPPLPPGLVIAAGTGPVSGTGVVSGTPTATAVATVHEITAIDAVGSRTTGSVSITVSKGQLNPPVISSVIPGSVAGSIQVLFTAPSNAPAGQTYAAEVYDAGLSTLVKTVRPMTSTTLISGLEFGATYQVVILADGSPNYLESRSLPVSGASALTGAQLKPPVITRITGGSAPGSLIVTFSPSPDAPQGQRYTVRVFAADQTTLIRTVARATSPAQVSGLTPGTTFFVVVSTEAGAGILEARSEGRTGTTSGNRPVGTTTSLAATVADPQATQTSTSSSVANSLGGRWTLASGSQAASARKVTVTGRPAARLAKAPTVRIPKNRAVSLRLSGLPPNVSLVPQVRIKGQWWTLGSVRVNSSGRAALPAFSATVPGAYPVRLIVLGRAPAYLMVKVKTKPQGG